MQGLLKLTSALVARNVFNATRTYNTTDDVPMVLMSAMQAWAEANMQRGNTALQSEPAGNDAMQNVEVGIPADSQVAVACGYMTRAKQSLAHVTLDELEQTLPLPPDEKLLPLEDGEEYQYFLQVSTYASTLATNLCWSFCGLALAWEEADWCLWPC